MKKAVLKKYTKSNGTGGAGMRRKERMAPMLSLQLKSGEYLTIGDNIAVQVFEQSGSTFRVAVKAPREVPILRGEVLERTSERPEGLHKKRPKSTAEQIRDARQLQKMAEKKERIEAERKRVSDEQTAVTEELKSILSRMDELFDAQKNAGMRDRIEELRLRLDGITNKEE